VDATQDDAVSGPGALGHRYPTAVADGDPVDRAVGDDQDQTPSPLVGDPDHRDLLAQTRDPQPAPTPPFEVGHIAASRA
jgi:hypothetical protein